MPECSGSSTFYTMAGLSINSLDESSPGNRLTMKTLLIPGSESKGEIIKGFKIDDTYSLVYTINAAGKGPDSMIISASLISLIETCHKKYPVSKPGTWVTNLLNSLNDYISEERLPPGKFASVLLILINTETGMCHMAAAGQDLLYIMQSTGKTGKFRLNEAPSLGIFENVMMEMQGMSFKPKAYRLKKGDSFLLFSSFLSGDIFIDDYKNEEFMDTLISTAQKSGIMEIGPGKAGKLDFTQLNDGNRPDLITRIACGAMVSLLQTTKKDNTQPCVITQDMRETMDTLINGSDLRKAKWNEDEDMLVCKNLAPEPRHIYPLILSEVKWD